MARGVYSVMGGAQTISTAITILEVAAPSTAVLQIVRAWVSQGNSTTSAQANIRILRKSATITGTATPPTPVALDASASSGVTVKWKATGEGTDGNILMDDNFNIITGYMYLPVPEERIIVPPSGIIALKFVSAPTSAAYSFGFTWIELG